MDVHPARDRLLVYGTADLVHGRCGGIRRQDVELVFPRKPPQFKVKEDLEGNKWRPHAKVDDPSIFLLTHDEASEDEKGELWAGDATLDDLAPRRTELIPVDLPVGSGNGSVKLYAFSGGEA
jgi:hypothetical protein